jgi:hypothetical protein
VRFTDFETDVGTMRIHGVGDDVISFGDDPEDTLIIHNVAPNPTLGPSDTTLDFDADGPDPLVPTAETDDGTSLDASQHDDPDPMTPTAETEEDVFDTIPQRPEDPDF